MCRSTSCTCNTVTVAKALKNKNETEWKDALQQLRQPSSNNRTKMQEVIYSSIQLSRGVQGPASTDLPARNRPDRRSTGGSESTYGRSRIGKKTTRIVRFGSGFQNISPGKPEPTALVIIIKKKSRLDISDSVI